MTDEQFDFMAKTVDRLMQERTKYLDALMKVGELTRWVGWGKLRAGSLAEDMEEIKEIVEQVTGKEFEVYT